MASTLPCQVLSLGKSSAQLHNALQSLAPENYEIVELDISENLLEEALQKNFDLVLLQLQSDAEEIKALCKNIKKSKNTKKAPIIVSAVDPDHVDIFSIYDMGVFDIIQHDISNQLFQKRIEVALKTRQESVKLEKKLSRAKETAFSAMADSNELGQVITFLNATANVVDYYTLAEEIFKTTAALDVSASVVFHSKQEDVYYSDDSVERPIEKKLLTVFNNAVFHVDSTCGRFKTKSNRIMITSRLCSLLIRNAPDDEMKVGRLRDILGALINGIEARAQTIEINLQAESNKALTRLLFKTIEDAMLGLGALFKEHESSTVAIMDNLMYSTQEGLAVLGLTEVQENYFLNCIEDSMAKLVGLYTKGVEFDNSFEKILSQLQELATQL